MDRQELTIEASGELLTVDDVRQVVLLVTPDRRTIRVADVARVQRTTASPPAPLARVDGKPAVVVGARARAAERVDAYGDQVRSVLDQFAQSLPEDVACVIVQDLARYTRERFAQLGWMLAGSIVLVFLATAAFMGWRAAAVVAAAMIPTSLASLALFDAFGVPLNEMSVMAIVMAIGLLVDSAIVVVEEIRRRVERGAAVEAAAAEEPHQLAVPLFVSTATTVAAFVPIFWLPGGVGEFLWAIPAGVAICLATSLVVSLTLIPWLATYVMRGKRTEPVEHDPRTRWGQDLARRAMESYDALLRFTVRRPWRTILAAVSVPLACASLGLVLRRDFFSPVQRDQIVVDVFAPQGTSVPGTAQIVEQAERMIAADGEVTSVAAFVGRNAPLVFYNLESQETYAAHYAQLIVSVAGWEKTADAAIRVQATLDRELVGAHACVRIFEHGAPFVAPFEVRIRGPSVETLEELGRRASAILAAEPSVRNVRANYGNEAVKLVAEVNEPVAKGLAVDHETIAEELRGRVDGLEAGFVRDGDEKLALLVRLAPADRRGVDALSALYLKPAPDRPAIPLAAVATLAPAWEAASLYRRDGERTLSVLAFPAFGKTAAEVANRFIPALDRLAASLPDGYSLTLGGENEQRAEAEGNLLGKGVYAGCLILLLVIGEFRTFRLTALVLAVIPLSLGGSMAALWLTGWPLNFMAMMGMMMVAGVVVNDSVVMMEGFERRRVAGEPLAELVVEGAKERVVHIVVTSVTTVAGFLPLALAPSLLWPPLALAIIGGLVLETVLTLVVVPAAYWIVRGGTVADGTTP